MPRHSNHNRAWRSLLWRTQSTVSPRPITCTHADQTSDLVIAVDWICTCRGEDEASCGPCGISFTVTHRYTDAVVGFNVRMTVSQFFDSQVSHRRREAVVCVLRGRAFAFGNLVSPAKLSGKSFVELEENHHSPKASEIICRDFASTAARRGEKVAPYMAELRILQHRSCLGGHAPRSRYSEEAALGSGSNVPEGYCYSSSCRQHLGAQDPRHWGGADLEYKSAMWWYTERWL